jgi:hypothetical protein
VLEKFEIKYVPIKIVHHELSIDYALQISR